MGPPATGTPAVGTGPSTTGTGCVIGSERRELASSGAGPLQGNRATSDERSRPSVEHLAPRRRKTWWQRDRLATIKLNLRSSEWRPSPPCDPKCTPPGGGGPRRSPVAGRPGPSASRQRQRAATSSAAQWLSSPNMRRLRDKTGLPALALVLGLAFWVVALLLWATGVVKGSFAVLRRRGRQGQAAAACRQNGPAASAYCDSACGFRPAHRGRVQHPEVHGGGHRSVGARGLVGRGERAQQGRPHLAQRLAMGRSRPGGLDSRRGLDRYGRPRRSARQLRLVRRSLLSRLLRPRGDDRGRGLRCGRCPSGAWYVRFLRRRGGRGLRAHTAPRR